MRKQTIATFALSLYIAFVFVQSLFFKWTGSAESIFIFSTLRDWSGIGLFEPFGRFFIGFCELIASILLFVPRARIWGAGMAIVIISGAITFHLFTPLGVEIMGDGGELFILACGVWLASATILLIHRRDVIQLLQTILDFLRRDKMTAH
jgi:hypothetical protein